MAGVVAAVLVVLVVVIVAVAASGSSSDEDGFVAHGTVQDYNGKLSGSTCTDKSYSYSYPIDVGDEVLISSADGKDLAVGRVEFQPQQSTSSYCTFTFRIYDVPSGERIYRISIDGKEGPRQSQQDLASGVELTIGK